MEGIRTFGDNRPLDQDGLATIFDYFRRQKESGEIELKPGVYNGVMVVRKSAYREIYTHSGDENYQAYLGRHMVVLNEMLDEAGAGVKAELKALVVVDDEVQVPTGIEPFWSQMGLPFDGLWTENNYDPTKEAYWDSGTRINRGLVHELMHAFLSCPDMYPLQYGFSDAFFPISTGTMVGMERDFVKNFIEKDGVLGEVMALGVSLDNLPSHWQEYSFADRNDRPPSMMDNCHPRIGEYIGWLLKSRRDIHNMSEVGRQRCWSFVDMVAGENVFDFGSKFSGGRIRVHRTQGTFTQRSFQSVFEGEIDGEGRVLVGDPFRTALRDNNGLIPAHQAVLLVEVVDKNGDRFVRYLDICDFSLGLGEKAEKAKRGRLEMKMNLAGIDESPQEMDWRIGYRRWYKNNLPKIGHQTIK